MPRQTTAYIAIGSNIDPRENIQRCLDLLASLPNSRLVAESSWYQTLPWGIEEQADFINLVVALETGLTAQTLLQQTQAIEQRLDRVRALKNGPRTIDLDISLWNKEVLELGPRHIPDPEIGQFPHIHILIDNILIIHDFFSVN